MVMEAPVWYLLARVDLVGGSTGWHRAELINTALGHISDWWLIGTDYTRHWMPYGVVWNSDHADLTNDYIQMGVWGGLPLMLLFIAVFCKAFQLLGQAIHTLRQEGDPAEFVLWCVGSCLFAHCMTFLSVSYYDQSRVALWMLIGVVPGLCDVVYSAGEKMTEVTTGTGKLDQWPGGEPAGNVDGGRAVKPA